MQYVLITDLGEGMGCGSQRRMYCPPGGSTTGAYTINAPCLEAIIQEGKGTKDI